MFNALFGKSSSKTITVKESTGDECMDEFLLVFLGEKTFNSVNVSEMVGQPIATFLTEKLATLYLRSLVKSV